MNIRADLPFLSKEDDGSVLRVVVVGAGPAGVRVAQELSAAGCDVTIFNAERWTAQNRIQLTPLLSGEAQIGEILRPPVFNGAGRVRLYSGHSIVAVDRVARTVTSRYGRVWPYDRLVLCMGSRPHVPPIPGADLSGVFRFRNVDDVERLVARLFSARNVVVIGGGLLGLEAARGIARRGAATTVVEHESQLMARQLDSRAGALLSERVASLGLGVRTGAAASRIEGQDRVEALVLADGERLRCDTIVICTGVRANIQLARDIGLAVGRGVTVSRRMQTSDPDIYAVGECAECDGHVVGLVGPCFEQAAVAARNIVGEPAEFTATAPSTKLKMLGADVFSMGEVDQIDQAFDLRTLTYESPADGLYRRIALRRGRLVGAIAIGEWPEIHRVQSALRDAARPMPWQLLRFRGSGRLWRESAGSLVAEWPSAATICNCTSVTRGQIGEAIVAGCTTLAAIREETSASTVCGSCRPLIEQLLDTPVTREPVARARPLAIGSALAALLVVIVAFVPRWPFKDEISRVGLAETLWLDGGWKQTSGYTLLAIFAVAAVLTLRKRLPLVRLGDFAGWRMIHAFVGAAALIGFVVHTGLRFGANLNAALAMSFAGLAVSGALAGLATAAEHRPILSAPAAARFRSAGFWIHVVSLWPLPLLLAAHVLSVYFY